MRHPIHLIFAVFFAAMMVLYVKRGNAPHAALDSSLATYWLMRLMEDE